MLCLALEFEQYVAKVNDENSALNAVLLRLVTHDSAEV